MPTPPATHRTTTPVSLVGFLRPGPLSASGADRGDSCGGGVSVFAHRLLASGARREKGVLSQQTSPAGNVLPPREG
jgi:hypothetical protein